MNRAERRRAARTPAVPHYMDKLLKAVQGRQLPEGVFRVDILHDDDCPFLAGTGPCRCDPDIRLPGELGTGVN